MLACSSALEVEFTTRLRRVGGPNLPGMNTTPALLLAAGGVGFGHAILPAAGTGAAVGSLVVFAAVTIATWLGSRCSLPRAAIRCGGSGWIAGATCSPLPCS
jgi:hypothetical protein